MTWLDPDQFGDAVMDYQHTAFRWECQGTYREPSENGPIQAWREGRIDEAYSHRPWLDEMRHNRAQGRLWQRVRMLTEPLTEYLQWMVATTHLNVEAGEDIRWLAESRAHELRMPDHDFYLLDDTRVLRLHFGEHGVAGADMVTDLGEVARHRRWRDLAWDAAIPHYEYHRKDPNAS
jgi:hypothetical protein